MKVLFTCLPAYGHFQPMAPLAAALRDRGDDVMFATGPDFVGRVTDSDFEVAAVGFTIAQAQGVARQGDASLRDDGTLRRIWDPFTFTHVMPGPLAMSRAQDLVPLAQDWKPDLIVHDPTDFAAPLAAQLIGAPHALHSWGPALPDKLLRRAGRHARELWESHGLEVPDNGGMLDGWYLDVCPPSLHPTDSTAPPAVLPLRPELFAAPTDLSHSLPLADLARDRTVLVTLGTVASQSAVTMRAIVDALADEPWDVIVTVGPGGDLGSAGPPRSNVLVTEYVPLAAVLPYCDLVVSHGGAGTVLAALSHGVPQVILGLHADNARTGALCARVGAARTVAPGQLTPAALHDAAAGVFADPSVGAAAEAVQAEIASLPSPQDVAANLVEIIDRRREAATPPR